jgi:hypothetical protein
LGPVIAWAVSLDDLSKGAALHLDTEEDKHAKCARQKSRIALALTDAMRDQGIPSDWMGCRTLRSSSSSGRNGIHVQFIVYSEGASLLARADRFQEVFKTHLNRHDPTAARWLVSMGWVLERGSFPPSDSHSWRLHAAEAASPA